MRPLTPEQSGANKLCGISDCLCATMNLQKHYFTADAVLHPFKASLPIHGFDANTVSIMILVVRAFVIDPRE